MSAYAGSPRLSGSPRLYLSPLSLSYFSPSPPISPSYFSLFTFKPVPMPAPPDLESQYGISVAQSSSNMCVCLRALACV